MIVNCRIVTISKIKNRFFILQVISKGRPNKVLFIVKGELNIKEKQGDQCAWAEWSHGRAAENEIREAGRGGPGVGGLEKTVREEGWAGE